MSQQRKILLICKESYTMPMHFLAKLLRKENAQLSAFFIMAHEALFNHEHYSFFKKCNQDIAVFDVKDIALKFIDDIRFKRIHLDQAYLDKIERTYATYKNINMQFMSSQFHTVYYHDLHYLPFAPYEVQLYWLQLYYQRVEEIIEKVNPDVIYDTDFSELGRVILLEIAHHRRIPYLCVDYARFDNYHIPTDNLGLGVSMALRERYHFIKNEIEQDSRKYPDSFEYLFHFRGRRAIMSEDQRMINPLLKEWDLLVEIVWAARLSWNTFLWGLRTRHTRKIPTLLYGNYLKRFFDPWLQLLRNYLIRKFEQRYFQRCDTKTMKYILLPLHLLPESSTFTNAPYFCNELFLIETLSKSVPWDVKILVKEHWSMLGQRPLNFYRRLRKLPNVVLISPFQERDPKRIIEDCLGVVTITGTTALEAAFLGKPSIIFGPTPFEVLSCVQRISDVTRVRDIIKGWLDGSTSVSDTEIVAYIEAVKQLGQNLSLKTLLYQFPNENLEETQWVSQRKRNWMEKFVRILRGKPYRPEPLEDLERKVKEETSKLKKILEIGYQSLYEYHSYPHD